MIKLSSVEATFLEAAGTELEVIDERRGVYGTITSCGYLAINDETGVGICTVFSNPSRPAACGEFQADSEPCNYMRRGNGITAR
jgi:hypothetical protein